MIVRSVVSMVSFCTFMDWGGRDSGALGGDLLEIDTPRGGGKVRFRWGFASLYRPRGWGICQD